MQVKEVDNVRCILDNGELIVKSVTQLDDSICLLCSLHFGRTKSKTRSGRKVVTMVRKRVSFIGMPGSSIKLTPGERVASGCESETV